MRQKKAKWIWYDGKYELYYHALRKITLHRMGGVLLWKLSQGKKVTI